MLVLALLARGCTGSRVLGQATLENAVAKAEHNVKNVTFTIYEPGPWADQAKDLEPRFLLAYPGRAIIDVANAKDVSLLWIRSADGKLLAGAAFEQPKDSEIKAEFTFDKSVKYLKAYAYSSSRGLWMAEMQRLEADRKDEL